MLEILQNNEFWTFVAVGFAAQMVDGALGMAYGTLSTAILLASGVPPLTVSATVHSAQFFTTGLSALSHSFFKNVNKRLFIYLAVSGSIGGMAGAMLLTKIPGNIIKPWIAGYLVFLGVLILWKRFRKAKIRSVNTGNENVFRAGLGLLGGFLDALGGGWGPMMTSNLIARDEDPRMVIGSVNTAEFFVKTLIAATLVSTIAFTFQDALLGLLLGGVLAAPFGAFVLRYIKPEILMSLVGVLVILISGFTLYKAIF